MRSHLGVVILAYSLSAFGITQKCSGTKYFYAGALIDVSGDGSAFYGDIVIFDI